MTFAMNPDDKTPLPPDPEITEPTAVAAAFPVWPFILLFMIFFWGMLYLDRHGGGFRAQVYEPYPSLSYVQALQPRTAGGEFIAKGRAIYAQNCLPCHGAGGLGAPAVAPPLAGSEWVVTPHPGRAIRIVLHGVAGPITVKGVEWNLTMLPFGHLDDEAVAAVLSYIRQEWNNEAPMVTPEQVREVREQSQGRSQNWTAAELLQFPESE
jgi:mono/diheme cytochrome c family protein